MAEKDLNYMNKGRFQEKNAIQNYNEIALLMAAISIPILSV